MRKDKGLTDPHFRIAVCPFCGQMSFVPELECDCELRRLHLAGLFPNQEKRPSSPAGRSRSRR